VTGQPVMADLLRTMITEVGPDVADLVTGGVLILFAAGAPPELAEVSVLHKVIAVAAEQGPTPGAQLRIGAMATVLTGVGSMAWAKVREMGHVVINFNGLVTPERPGELCAARIDLAALSEALRPGAEIIISAQRQ
jgi:PTS system glucitol/sorbitol-specific IIA component